MHFGRSSTCVRSVSRCTSAKSLENASDATLCRRWRDRHDISAARQLAERHRHLVLALTEVYRVSGLPLDDLTGEAQLGLMRAICRFDLDQDIAFVTCAAWCVTVTLQAYVLKHSSHVFGQGRVVDNRRSSDAGRRRAEPSQAMSGIAA
jgi:DNA-directed RNA polymerase sigma subunit (sigma70/sigma32)